MSTLGPVHVADVVRFLQSFAPEAIEEVRRAHPDPSAQAALQAEGAVLGGADVMLDAAVDTAEAFLREIDEAALDALRAMRGKLKFAQYVELGGKLLALGSATALVSVLLGDGGKTTALVLAVISFLAAAIPLIVGFLRGSLSDPAGVQHHYAALGEASFEAKLLRSRLDAAKRTRPRDRAGLAALTDSANELARKTHRILTDLGYDRQLAAAAA